MEHLQSVINLLKSSIHIIQSEVDDVKANKTQHVAAHAEQFLAPFLAKLNSARLMAISTSKAGGNEDNTMKYVRDMFKSADSHHLGRLQHSLNSDDQYTLEMLLADNVQQTHESLDVIPVTQSFSLLQTVNGVRESATFPVTNLDSPHIVEDDVKIPAEVKKAVIDKLAELRGDLEKQIQMFGKTDYAVRVPADPFPSPNRIRRGLDAAIGMMEQVEASFSSNRISYSDLKWVVLKLNTYGNVISQHIPPEVIKFLLTAGRWKQWQLSSDAKYGKKLDGADPVTGLPKSNPATD